MVQILGILLVVAMGQANHTISAKQLSPKSRPIMSIPGLNNKDIVTVSRYTSQDSSYPIYVYRYTYPGHLADTLAAFKKDLPKKDGWTLDASNPNNVIIERKVKSGPVVRQALVVQQIKLLFDEHGGHPSKSSADKEWIWVSYNEDVREKK